MYLSMLANLLEEYILSLRIGTKSSGNFKLGILFVTYSPVFCSKLKLFQRITITVKTFNVLLLEIKPHQEDVYRVKATSGFQVGATE